MNSELNILNANQPFYYHREYINDIPEPKVAQKTWVDDVQRVGLVALPFISLYKPLSFPLSLATGGLRVFACSSQLLASIQQGDGKEIAYQSLQTSIAVIALAGTILAHPLGMLITTTHDILIELSQLLKHLQNGDYEKAVLSCANIVNNSLYLALFMDGGLEIGAASLAVQMLIGFYHSYDEFNKGNHLEAAGHILMGLIRCHQLNKQLEVISWHNKMKAMTASIASGGLLIITNPAQGDIKTTISPEGYTIKTVQSIPWILELKEGDCCYWPITLTDGTIWNDHQNGFPYQKLHPGDQVQQVIDRYKHYRPSCSYEDLLSSTGVQLVKLVNGEQVSQNLASFIHTPDTPDHIISNVQKVTWEKETGIETYPLITLADQSQWLLSKVEDTSISAWKEGMRIMIMKNIGLQDVPSYSFVQPRRTAHGIDADAVYSEDRMESFVEMRTIPSGEYTIKDWK